MCAKAGNVGIAVDGAPSEWKSRTEHVLDRIGGHRPGKPQAGMKFFYPCAA